MIDTIVHTIIGVICGLIGGYYIGADTIKTKIKDHAMHLINTNVEFIHRDEVIDSFVKEIK